MANRAVVFAESKSDHPVLELINKSVPEALPGRVVVHILLRPINPTDLVSTIAFTVGSTPGLEGYGIVHSIGDGVTKVKPGDRVVPFIWEGLRETGDGSWQEYVSVRENMLTPVPNSIPDEVAAQFVLNPWTALGLLKALNTPRGEYILQTAAGSVLGRMVIQLAKYMGIKTINIVRREEQKEELKALGADEVICSTTEDVVARVEQITDKKLVYAALDAVAGESTKMVASTVRRRGTVLVYGILSSMEASVHMKDLLREVNITGWLFVNYWDIEEYRKDIITEAWKLMESKIIQPLPPSKIFDIAEFESAVKASKAVGRGGKLFLSS